MRRFFILTVILWGVVPASAAFREFKDRAGRSLVAEIQSKTDTMVTMKRKGSDKKFTLKITTFGWDDQEYIRNWAYGQEDEESMESSDAKKTSTDDDEPNFGEVPEGNRLYPRAKEEIKKGMAEIKSRPRPEEVTKAEWEAVTNLNLYRLLSGVPSEVKSDPKLNQYADLAAKACTKAGHLSHDLGDYTDKCNLAGGGGMVKSVRQYIDDSGDNNRVARGHRRWCLNPPMGKTGFGGEEGFSAMWAIDNSGSSKMDFWAYPGEGLYPEEFLTGNSWSAYFDEAAPDKKKVKVRVFKMRSRPEKKPIKLDEINGRELEVPYIATASNGVNFEVTYQGSKKGIYWVSIKGGGLSEGYLVEVF